MPTCACENDRVGQKVADQVVKLVAKRGEEKRRARKPGRSELRYQIGYYMGLQQKHTASSWFYNSGKISEGSRERERASADLRGFGFYGRKGSSALIMPHLKMPRHTLAQFRVVPLRVRSTNSTHANSSSATLITDYIPRSARIVQRLQIRMVRGCEKFLPDVA